jgi:hypothetical protein
MIEIVLGVIVLFLIGLNAFQMYLRKQSGSEIAKDYELVLETQREANRELTAQLIKITLSKNVVDFTTSNLMEEPVKLDEDTKEEYVSAEQADDQTFEKMIHSQLHPEEEVKLDG